MKHSSAVRGFGFGAGCVMGAGLVLGCVGASSGPDPAANQPSQAASTSGDPAKGGVTPNEWGVLHVLAAQFANPAGPAMAVHTMPPIRVTTDTVPTLGLPPSCDPTVG